MATSADSLISSLLQQPGLIGQAFQQGQQANDQHAQAGIDQQIGQQEVQQNAGLLDAQAAQQQQNQQYGQWWQQYVANPTDAMLRQGVAQFPSRWKDIQAQKSALEAPARQSQNLILGQVWHAAKNGNADLVASHMQSVIDAERAAKMDTSEAERTLAAVKAGDKDALREIQAFAQVHLAAGDPEFAKNIGITGDSDKDESTVINAGGSLVRKSDGSVLFHAPDAQTNALEVPIYNTQGQRVGTRLVPNGGKGNDLISGGGGGGGGGAGGASPAAGHTVGGWTPRSRNGGDNSDAAVDGKISGMAASLGIAPTATFPAGMTNRQVFDALTISEGGKGSLADRNNNPGNLTDPKTGAYRKFPTREAGIAAGVAQVARNRARGQNSIQTMVEGRPAGGKFAVTQSAGAGNDPSYIGPVGGEGSTGDGSIGPDYLAKLQPGRRGIVQAILDGRVAAPRAGTRFGEGLAEDVARADPSFDPSLQPARMQARKDFTGNGRAAQVASSGNRLAYHLNDLWRDSRALSGPDLGWSPLSNLATGAAQSFQQAAVARYNAVLPFISGELQKLTKNGQSTEGETNKIIQNLRPNQPTAVREAAIQQVVDLATGQFKPFRNQWNSAFQGKPPPVDFTPTTQKIFARIAAGEDALHVDQNGNEIDSRHAGRRQAGAGQPVRLVSIQQAMALPKGTVFLTPDGRRKVR